VPPPVGITYNLDVPEITKLVPRRRETWLEICTAGESIRLPADKVPSGLAAGTRLDDEQWAGLCAQSEFWLLQDKAVSILARREHFRRELEIKLGRQCRDRDLIRRVLDECEEMGYINSRRAAELTVQTLLNRGGLGTMRIRQELIKRGCPRELLDEVVAEAAGDRDEVTEMEALLNSRRQSLRSRLHRTKEKLAKKGLTDTRLEREVRQQLEAAVLRLLNGRGFSGDGIYKLAARFAAELISEADGGE